MDSFFESNPWAQDPSFNHFWRHYNLCDQWLKHHKVVAREAQMQFYSSAGPSVENEFGEEEPEVTERLSRCEIRNEDMSEEVEVEVMSDEMKAFFAKTQEHRQKLKEKRDAEKRKEETIKQEKRHLDYVSVDQISVRGRVQHSANHHDANSEFIEKREKARKDYGDAATRILAMESALEMQFETEFASNPQLWPNIPFKF